MHQHPPKMPLLRSTSAANAGHVDSSRAFTVYVGSDTKPSLMRATAQASLGAGERIRTADLPFTRRLLCQLSYTGVRLAAW
jgi:hypothetical protein